jgi:ABC-type transporter Mla MlaB component
MLRITVHTNADPWTLQLEGKLAGPWVREAEDCWRQTWADRHEALFRLDLTGVTTVDAAGKAFLASAHAAGAELVASGCLMRAIVAELTQTAVGDCGWAGKNLNS